MLRCAAVPVVASGIVGRIVFICTHQYSSAFQASGSTISFAKFLSAAVREYPYRRVLLSVLFVLCPSRSITKLFHAAHHLMSCESQGKFRRSHAYHGFQPLLPFIICGPLPVLPHHPQRFTRPQIRLLPCTFLHVVTAVSAFYFGTHAFPIAEATQLQTCGVATCVDSVVRVQFHPSAWRLSCHLFLSGASICSIQPSSLFHHRGLSVISGVVVGCHFPLEGDSVSFCPSFFRCPHQGRRHICLGNL